MTLLLPWLRRSWLARGFHALMERAGVIMTFTLQDGGLRSIGDVLAKKTNIKNSRRTLLGLSKECAGRAPKLQADQ